MRGDIADVRLADRVFAPHYAVALPCHAARRADILIRADDPASVRSEILPGETFEVLELSSAHAWGRCAADGSVGFVPREALGHGERAVDAPASAGRDFVAVAEQLVGTPGKPGGRSPAGVDCSGLVFLALTSVGEPCPRFLDYQRGLGAPVPDDAGPVRGDLIFFDAHVAIMADAAHAIHAGAASAPVERVALAALVAGAFGAVTDRRRLA